MDLLIDCGNSRLKWAYSAAGRLSAHGQTDHQGGLPQEARQAWSDGPPPRRVIVANVAAEALAGHLTRWAAQQWQCPIEFLQVPSQGGGITLAYARPEQFGIDRWLALVAARHCCSGAVAVIDAGTALTLDVLDAEGRHLGGIILPGLALMTQALAQKSSGIRRGLQDLSPSVTGVLGTDTASGIKKGSLYAVTGAIEHVLARLGTTTGAGPSVILCGGDAAPVMAELNVECQHIPDLVLRGMQISKGS